MSGPRNESDAVLLALSKELLKIKGILIESAIELIDSAICKL